MNKKILIINLILVLFGLSFSSCVDEEMDKPPIIIPAANLTATHTISQLIGMYDTVLYKSFNEIKDSIIIEGYISTTDSSGNIYKALYIQDDSVALKISINAKDMYKIYPLGQKVFIKCKGLSIGNYGNSIQMGGAKYSDSPGQMTELQMKKCILKDGLPGKPVAPIKIDYAKLSHKYDGMLIQLDSMSFREDSLKTFSLSLETPTAANYRNLYDNQGHVFQLRTSAYATFKNDKTPSGTGTVYAVFTLFNNAPGTYQLSLIRKNDVRNFK